MLDFCAGNENTQTQFLETCVSQSDQLMEENMFCVCVCLYIDQQKPGNSRPESSVDLRGAQLHWANNLSSKKNVFKVKK